MCAILFAKKRGFFFWRNTAEAKLVSQAINVERMQILAKSTRDASNLKSLWVKCGTEKVALRFEQCILMHSWHANSKPYEWLFLHEIADGV